MLVLPGPNEDIMVWTDRAFVDRNENMLTRQLWDNVMEYSIEEYLIKS